MKTLELFNAVLAKPLKSNAETHVSQDGYIIEPDALWAKDRIIKFYLDQKLSGEELNKTFHKSWYKVINSTRAELALEQIKHYMSTYGTNFQGEVYIPSEVLELPNVKLKFKVICALSKDELKEKALNMLKSGMALKEETIDSLISVLVDDCDYVFTGKEGITNKEAIVKIAEGYGVYPDNPTEFLRYLIYRTTDQTLLIKNRALISAIENGSYNPTVAMKKFGLKRLAEIFNRFKPLFLAFKNRSAKTINRISKLSKKYHKPLVSNPLNKVTSQLLTKNELHWLDNATPYALMKALHACNTRLNAYVRMTKSNITPAFVYKVRNGKSFVKENSNLNENICERNLDFIMNYMKNRFNLEGLKVYIPKDIEYGMPTSEKMYVGNIPTGTKFYANKIAAGVYWEDSWGARDWDLSGINIGGKIGWNAAYSQGGDINYSGDITSAPNGAVEYLYGKNGFKNPTMILNNMFSGNDGASYKVVLGQIEKEDRDYMMNPDNLFFEVKVDSVERKMVVGLMLPATYSNDGENLLKKTSFVLLNFGAGNTRVSGYNEIADQGIRALYNEWSNPITFNDLLEYLGAELVEKNHSDVDLGLDVLEKDSFTKLFTKKVERKETFSNVK